MKTTNSRFYLPLIRKVQRIALSLFAVVSAGVGADELIPERILDVPVLYKETIAGACQFPGGGIVVFYGRGNAVYSPLPQEKWKDVGVFGTQWRGILCPERGRPGIAVSDMGVYESADGVRWRPTFKVKSIAAMITAASLQRDHLVLGTYDNTLVVQDEDRWRTQKIGVPGYARTILIVSKKPGIISMVDMKTPPAVYWTNDNGYRWYPIAMVDGVPYRSVTFRGVSVLSDQMLVAIASLNGPAPGQYVGRLLVNQDGGRTWSALDKSFDIDREGIESLTGTDDQIVMAARSSVYLLREAGGKVVMTPITIKHPGLADTQPRESYSVNIRSVTPQEGKLMMVTGIGSTHLCICRIARE